MDTEQAGRETEKGVRERERTPGDALPDASVKFADIGQLWKAYRSLQAEFTRQCQRLSELERAGRETGTPRAEEPKGSALRSGGAEGARKKQPSAGDFFRGRPDGGPEETEDFSAPGDGRVSFVPKEGKNFSDPGEGKKSRFDSGDGTGGDEDAARDSCAESSRRERIIREYLNSVAARTAGEVSVGGGRAPFSPARRPESLAEAGELFLRNLK